MAEKNRGRASSPAFSERYISTLVTGRASKHLRYATVALCGTLLLVVGMLVHLQQQYGSVTENFTDNENVHYLAVTFRASEEGAETGHLRFSDMEAIEEIARNAAAGSIETIGRYHLPFGLVASDGSTYFVDGLGAGGEGLLGHTDLPDGVALGAVNPAARVVLTVPVVHTEVGGMVSDDSAEVPLAVVRLDANPPISVFAGIDPSQLYVSEATFAELISIVGGGADWDTFREQHDGTGNPYGFEAVPAVYVHVDQLADADAVGRALEDAGYSTTYTLRAFDDLAGTLAGGVSAALVLIVVAFALCLLLTFANLQGYLTLAHRDMGILKHTGYSERRIATFYRIRLATMVLQAVVPAVVLVVLAWVTRFPSRPWVGVLDLAVVLTLAALLFGVMAYAQVPRHVRRPVLELLKMDRQFD
ncbi:hypothetical protein [Demequina aestuarii]|uniref:hypothetical protein n=1 Tax=Demequina aestuarii TaxID=327095 RepID=UPI0007815F6D|nr:hypothetical protein [Demequina aestuarii]